MEKRTGSLKKVIVAGGSAGSLEAMLRLAPALRPDMPYPVVVVMHRRAAYDTKLADVFRSRTSLQVKEVEDKESLLAGVLYIAPGDYHLLFEKDGTLSLDDSEKVNFSRPSIDVSFQSAADAYGAAAVCILLSGANADGTEGLLSVRAAGGAAIVQQPDTAGVAYMPQQAIDRDAADYVMDIAAIAGYLNGL